MGDKSDYGRNKKEWATYYGVITRTRFAQACRVANITDGTSNTMMISEKWLNPLKYKTTDWHDDRVWTEGWDPDIARLTSVAPIPMAVWTVHTPSAAPIRRASTPCLPTATSSSSTSISTSWCSTTWATAATATC
jgi:hypothetical protein